MPRTKKLDNKEKEKKAKTERAIKKEAIKTGLTIKVYDLKGKEKKEVELPKEIFDVKGNLKVLAQYVRIYLANQRQGTASTKTRGEVAGSTRKIYRQKGTGRARHGSIKAPIFVGGGITFGPKPRDYSLKLNKKMKKLALYLALTLKNKEGKIIGLADEFMQIEPKTKVFAQFLNNLGLEKEKILLLTPDGEKRNLILAVRNLPNLKYQNATSINPYTILNSDRVMIIEDALKVIKNTF